MPNAFDQFDTAPANAFDRFDAPPQKPEGLLNAVGRGVKESFQQLPQLAYGVGAGVAAAAETALGTGGIATAAKNAALEGYQRWSDKIAAHAQENDSIDTAWDKAQTGNPGALVDWLAHGIGYTGGQALQVLASGGLGFAAGKVTAMGAAKAIASGMIRKESERIGEEIAAKRMGEMSADEIAKTATANVAGKLGQTAALGVNAFGQEGGEIFGDLVSKNKERALTGGELGRGFGATLAAGGLGFVGEKLGLDTMLGKFGPQKMPGLVGRAARAGTAAAVNVPVEGGTEYGQTLLEEYGKGNEDTLDPRKVSEATRKQARESAALGALGGGVVSLASAVHGPEVAPAKPILEADTPDQVIDRFRFEVSGDKPDLTEIRKSYKNHTPEQTAEHQSLLVKALENDHTFAQDEAGNPMAYGAPLKALAPQELPTAGTKPEVLTRDAYEAIAALNQAQGKRTVVYEDAGQLPEGVVNSDKTPGVAFISSRANTDPVAIAAHEVQHLSEQGEKQAEFIRVVNEELTEHATEVATQRHGELEGPKLAAEIRADIAGDAWADPTFHGRVIAKMREQLGDAKAESTATTFLESIKELIARVRAVVTGTTFSSPNGQRLATQYVKNLERVHDALAAAIADNFIQQGYRPPGAQTNTAQVLVSRALAQQEAKAAAALVPGFQRTAEHKVALNAKPIEAPPRSSPQLVSALAAAQKAPFDRTTEERLNLEAVRLGVRGNEPAPTVEEVHALAEEKGIPSDNDPAFAALTKAVTGKEHLDELTPGQLRLVYKKLEVVKAPLPVVPPAQQPAREVLAIPRGTPEYEGLGKTTVAKQMAEYEGRFYGGAYDASRLGMMAKDAPMRAAIMSARESYNKLRKHVGLQPVTDWTKRPAASKPAALESGRVIEGEFTVLSEEVATTLAIEHTATVDKILEPKEKAAAAAELGHATWNEAAKKSFIEKYAEWLQQGARDLGTKLSDLFRKVYNAAKTGALAISVAFNFNIAEVAKPLPVRASVEQVKVSVERPRANFNGVKASPDAHFVADWIVRTGQQQAKPFIIADKSGGLMYAFDATGKLLAKSPALFGKAKADTITAAQAAKGINETTDADKITPAGVFNAKATTDSEYGNILNVAEFASTMIAIHRVYLGTASEHRMQRLQSESAEDNRISYGCINAMPEFIDQVVTPHFADGGTVVVLPETTDAKSYFGINDSAYETKTVEVRKGSDEGAAAVSWGSDKYALKPQFSPREDRAKLEASRNPHAGTTINIGLDIGDKKDALSPKAALTHLKLLGAKVTASDVVKSSTENTLVARLEAPLSREELHKLSVSTQQGAIAQYSNGRGDLEGPKAADWGGKFLADQFKTIDGRTLSDIERPKAAPAVKDPRTGVALTKQMRAASLSDTLYGDKAPFTADTQVALAEVLQDFATSTEPARTDDTPENREFMARVIEHEARLALGQSETAVGWYRATTDKALKIAALIYPEIATDPNARFAFTYALAVTSNGATIAENVRNAFTVYKSYAASGRMPDIGFGVRKNNMQIAFRVWNDNVVIRKMGVAGFSTFMLSKQSVRDLKKLNPAIAEVIDAEVYAGTIIGPKIGGAFLQNLNGNYDALAMDRWFMRTWGRISGDLVGTKKGEKTTKDAPANGSQRQYIRGTMATTLARLQKDHPDLTMSDLQALLWYPEKDLYAMHGVNDESGKPTDYEIESAAYAKLRGVDSGAIEAARVQPDQPAGRGAAGEPGRASGAGGEATIQQSPKQQGAGTERGGVAGDAGVESREADRERGLTQVLKGWSRQVGPDTPVFANAGPGKSPVSLVGIHYGDTGGLTALDPARFGTGARSEESKTLTADVAPHLHRRVYFYAQKSDGKLPDGEHMVSGGRAYRILATNLYDTHTDPDGIITQWVKDGRPGGYHGLEDGFFAAGYDGYFVRNHTPDGAFVLVGSDKPVPVEYLGTRADAREELAQTEGAVQLSPKTPEFKKWFGDSKVVDARGEPLVVYHGTRTPGFDQFDSGRVGKQSGNSGFFGAGFYFTDSASVAGGYAGNWEGGGQPVGGATIPVYLSIRNALAIDDDPGALQSVRVKLLGLAGLTQAERTALESSRQSEGENASLLIPSVFDGARFAQLVQSSGHDGVIAVNSEGSMGATEYVVFRPEQIKSVFNTKPDESAQFSPKITGDSKRPYTTGVQDAFRNVGRTVEAPTLRTIFANLKRDLGKKLVQGLVDQFAPLKELSPIAYMLARLSKGSAGALEAFLKHGKLTIKGGAYDGDRSGGFIDKVLIPLQGEAHDWLWWMAAHRAEMLAREDREHLFDKKDIAALKSLATGDLKTDYTFSNGTSTRSRELAYKDSAAKYDAFNRNILDMAEQSGLLKDRASWERMMYVPFYRVSEDGGFVGGKVSAKLVGQSPFKHLKGGTEKLNNDLLENVISNWFHLLDAGVKNRAAKESLEAAAAMGSATESDAETVKAMARAAGQKSAGVWFLDQGVKRHFAVGDPMVLTAITSLQYAGMKGPIMDAMGTFKHVLTVGVTASPFFKVRNLIRDSLQAVATADLSYNIAGNIKQGIAASSHSSQTYVSMLASGGLIRFGTMLEGKASRQVDQLVRQGVNASTILNTDTKLQKLYSLLDKGLAAYNEVGNRSEEITRAALYKQLTDKGVSHAEASLMARDLLDFSLQGSYATMRFLTQVVPFLNARMQGLYKLGRAAKDDPARFAAVLGATALMSVGLMLAYKDDDDWKKREDWDKEAYWWVKIGGTAYRIPNGFETGAIAALATHGLEYFTDPEMTGARLGDRTLQILGNNLNMNPMPQVFKPWYDVATNTDNFSGRPIETAGMEKLRPDYRFTSNTSMLARAAGTAGQAATGAVGLNFLSPVQIDHVLRGYFSWLGSFVIGSADLAARPLSGEPSQPSGDMFKLASGNMVSELPSDQSRYVSHMYQQAKVVEQAYGTYHQLLKEGKRDDAAEFLEANRSDITQYKRVEEVKRAESKFNERIRIIERSALDPDAKRVAIQAIAAQKDRVARLVQ